VISAIIPTYRGAAHLAQNLPPLLASLENSGPAEVIVVDDGGGIDQPPDGVRLVVLDENHGYGPAVNAGVRSSRGDYLLILNDDVTVQHDTVAGGGGGVPGGGVLAGP
jgi:glycosyltransferase involved in cell wall biosynthesis